MKELTSFQNTIFRTGAVLFVLGLGVRLFVPFWGMIIFVVGVLGFTTMQMLCSYEGNSVTLLRLRRQQVMSDFLFLLSAVAMMSQELEVGPMWARRNLWILIFAIGCFLQLYTAFRIPSVMEKERKMHLHSGTAMMLLLPMLCMACSPQYTVHGTTNITMLDGKTLYLKVFAGESLQSLDSCKVQHGRISFSGTLDSTQMVNIFMDDESMMPMVLEEGVISLTIDESKQNVTGSPLNDTLYNFIRSKVKLDRAYSELGNLETKLIREGVGEEERQRIMYEEEQQIAYENDQLVTSFIVRNSDNVLGPGVFMIMTSGFPFPQLTPQIEEIVFRAQPYFKNHPYVKRYLDAAKQNMEKIHTGVSE